jgi:hypothetical protein
MFVDVMCQKNEKTDLCNSAIFRPIVSVTDTPEGKHKVLYWLN